MAENKTKPSSANVEGFLNGVEDPERREDCRSLARIMEEITGEKPKMWGTSIVGFGQYRYTYASGRGGDWFLCGFSPRKQNLTVYVAGYLENYEDALRDLGKHKTGKGCLYIKKLSDVDLEKLKLLLRTSIGALR